MTMDVSTLAIVVKSEGIASARDALQGRNGKGGLAGAADKAEASVGRLTDRLQKLMNVNASGTTAAWNASLTALTATLSQMGGIVTSLNTNLGSLVNGMNNAASATNNAHRANREYAGGSHVVSNTLKALLTVSTAYAAVNLVGSIVKQADAWQMMTARLENATGSLNNAKVAQQQMMDLSQRLRVPLEDSVKLYTRMAPAIQRMGKDSGYAKDMVEGIATALQLGGANGAEASSVMLQLSQSFSSGVLNGAEFNAVAENGSVLMRALERSTGKSTAELKKLGSTGKLSVQDLGKAIQENLPLWREQFDKLPMTFEGGVQRLKNAWTQAVGEMGQDTGFNQQLSQSLRIIEEMIPAVAQGLGKAFIGVMGWVNENKDILLQIWDQLVGIGKDVWEMATGFASWIGKLLGAGEEVSVVGLLLYTARLTVAAIADAFKLVSAAVVYLGARLIEFLLLPVRGALIAIEKLGEGFAWILELAAKGARAVGNDSLAESFESAAASTRNFASGVGAVDDGIKNALASARAFGTEMLDSMKNGGTNFERVLNETKTLAAEKKKLGEMDEKAWNANKNPKAPVDEKAAAAAAKAMQSYLEHIGEANAKLKEQEELQKRLAIFGLDYDKIGANQKKVIELQEKLAAVGTHWAKESEAGHIREELAIYKKAAALEVLNARTIETLKNEQAWLDKGKGVVANVEAEVVAMRNKVATYGMAKGAVEELELAQAKQSLAELEATSDGQRSAAMEARIADLKREIAARGELATVTEQYGALQVKDEFAKLMDPKRAEKFGDVLAEGFGKGVKALGTLMNAMDSYQKRMGKVAQAQKLIDKETDPIEKAKMTKEASEMEAEYRLASYADMAGAAKGFFEEGSKGYKVLEAAEKTFRLFQMAMAVESFLEQSGLLAAFTALFVGAKATETAAEVASVVPHVAAEGVKQGANAITALTSALAAPFPMNIAAYAMVAAMLAAIGVAVGGSGGGGASLSESRQAKQGTGTVLGDENAKSSSIADSISLLADNSDIALRYSSGMLTSLQSIEASLTGVTNSIIRNGELTGQGYTGSSSNTFSSLLSGMGLLGGTIGGVLDSLFGSSKKLVDAGITGSTQNVGDILNNGFQGSSYQDVETTKKFFGISYGKSTSRDTQALDPALEAQFTAVIDSMVSTLTDAAVVLGMSEDEVTAKLEAANIALGDISLKDLAPDEIQAQLEAVFSAFGDQLSQVLFSDTLNAFQQAGEGLLETAVRVASGVESANYELEKLGLTAIDFADITNKSGDVAAEIVRQSILVTEAGTGVGDIIGTLSGSASDIASVYTDLVDVRGSLQRLGLAEDVSRDMIRAAGGLSALQDALQSYTENYFTDAEQAAMKTSAVSSAFSKLGLAMPASNADFRTLVETLNASGTEGQLLATKVLLLADSFADLTDTTDALVESARSDLTDAYERESQALVDTRDKFLEFTKSLGDFKESLITGDLSTLSASEKYATNKAKYEDVATRAAAGDVNAIAEFQQVAEQFLTSSRDVYASGAQYTSDFEKVLAATAALESSTSTAATVAEQQLAALDAQVAGLMTVNESVLTVAQAIINLQEAMGLGKQFIPTTPTPDGSHANGLSMVPFDGYIAELHKGEAVLTASENAAYQGRSSGSENKELTAEIRALRAEVTELRNGQREQTGQLIAATYDSNEQNAQTIVEGQRDAASSNNYIERVKGKLA